MYGTLEITKEWKEKRREEKKTKKVRNYIYIDINKNVSNLFLKIVDKKEIVENIVIVLVVVLLVLVGVGVGVDVDVDVDVDTTVVANWIHPVVVDKVLDDSFDMDREDHSLVDDRLARRDENLLLRLMDDRQNVVGDVNENGDVNVHVMVHSVVVVLDGKDDKVLKVREWIYIRHPSGHM